MPVTVLPGPSAVETALVASGLVGERYQFVGYLPRGERALPALGEELAGWPWPVVAFESPQRLPRSLAALARVVPERPVAVCRELTKRHRGGRAGDGRRAGGALRRAGAKARSRSCSGAAPPREPSGRGRRQRRSPSWSRRECRGGRPPSSSRGSPEPRATRSIAARCNLDLDNVRAGLLPCASVSQNRQQRSAFTRAACADRVRSSRSRRPPRPAAGPGRSPARSSGRLPSAAIRTPPASIAASTSRRTVGEPGARARRRGRVLRRNGAERRAGRSRSRRRTATPSRCSISARSSSARGPSWPRATRSATVGTSGVPALRVPYVYLGVRVASEPQGYVDPLLPAAASRRPPVPSRAA